MTLLPAYPPGYESFLAEDYDGRPTTGGSISALKHRSVDEAAQRRAGEWRKPEQPELLDISHPREEAGAVLRAGLTDVFVTGMLMR